MSVHEISRRLINGIWRTVDAEENGDGGSQPGAPIVRGPFLFAFNTPNIADGVAFYTPTIGDLLLNAVFEVVTTWDAFDAHADLGQFPGSETHGIFDLAGVVSSGYILEHSTAFSGLSYISPGLEENGTMYRFTTADPLLVVVSTDGTRGGTPPTLTQGTARIWLVTATPVAL